MLLVLYGPLFVAVFFSFFEFQNNAVQWDSFSFDAYVVAAPRRGDHRGGRATRSSSAPSPSALALILGTALAFHYNGSRSRFRELLQLVIFLPFLMPPIITGLSLLIFFREIDVPRSLWTVIIGHTVFVARPGLPHRARPAADAAREPGRGLARSRRQPLADLPLRARCRA